ncbi:TPA: hypothetical protein EYN09_24010, partial [Candidatus Poribacteria bacterium]|nr:hypothetical protein [Candidatus Poribacteria bacterium]
MELDVYLYRGHLGQAVIPVPLALAEAFNLDGKAILTAQVAANELAGRLGAAITSELLHGHQRSYLQRFAAAICAAKLPSLNQECFAEALAIAMTQPKYPLHVGEFSSDTKVLSAASSVVEGTRSAFLASEGMTGTRNILEHQGGFYRQFTLHRNTPQPFLQLGEAWVTETLAFKRYSACAYAQGAIDCIRVLSHENTFEISEIKKIEIFTMITALVMEHLAIPHYKSLFTPVNVQFSVARSVAMALFYKDLRGYHFTPENFEKALPTIKNLSKQTDSRHDWKLTIQLLRGVDDGIIEGSSKHSAGMLEFYRTSPEFRRRFVTMQSLGFRDIPALLALDKKDLVFFLNRFARGFHSKVRPTR